MAIIGSSTVVVFIILVSLVVTTLSHMCPSTTSHYYYYCDVINIILKLQLTIVTKYDTKYSWRGKHSQLRFPFTFSPFGRGKCINFMTSLCYCCCCCWCALLDAMFLFTTQNEYFMRVNWSVTHSDKIDECARDFVVYSSFCHSCRHCCARSLKGNY